MKNALMVIFPYKFEDMWVFDDAAVGLAREPFVCGVPDMIEILVQHIPDSDSGFKLIFSENPFPGYQAELTWIRGEYGGNWYSWRKMNREGWLCPALFKYFESVPAHLYCQTEGLKRARSKYES